jgi:alkylhydroperoxidase family enzyme
MLNIFGTLRRNPRLYKAFLALGGHLLGASSVPAREREIVILRTGRQALSEYEFGQHTALGRQAGLTDAEIRALAGPDGAGDSLAEADSDLVNMVDELCAEDIVSERTWQRLAQRWTDEQLLELLVLAGFYRLVSGVLTSVGVALEEGTAGWPAEAGELRRAPRDERPAEDAQA